MSDYIERKKAIEITAETGSIFTQIRIKELPAADVAPIVYGEWLENESFDDGFWTCSACGFVSEADAAPYLYRYCPHCGAKMQTEG